MEIKDLFGEAIRAWADIGKNWVWPVLPIVVIGIYRIVAHFSKEENRKNVFNPWCWVPSLLLLIIASGYYWWPQEKPSHDNEFVVAIARFHPVPVNEEGKDECETLADRIKDEIYKGKKKYPVNISVVLREEELDCSDESGVEGAIKLAEQIQAHIVICGKVRKDQEYLFEAKIVPRKGVGVSGCVRDSVTVDDLSDKALLSFKEEKISKIEQIVQLTLGLALFNDKDYSNARLIFNSLTEDTEDKYYYIGRSYYFDTNLDFNYRMDQALLALKNAVAIAPKHYCSWLAIGNVFSKLGNYKESRDADTLATIIDPNRYEAWYNKGNAHFELKEYMEAIAAFENAIRTKPSLHEAWYNKGHAYYELKEYKDAIASYNEAIKIKPDKAEAWMSKGNAELHLDLYEDASKSYKRVTELTPKNPDAHLNHFVALTSMENKPEALESLRRAIGLDINGAVTVSAREIVEAPSFPYQNDPEFRALVGLPPLPDKP